MPDRKKISLITSDFSNNCFGRTWLLAGLLKNVYDIEVIGPAFGDGIWDPLKNSCDFPLKIFKGSPDGRFSIKKMLKEITGDIIYANKPLMTSFGVGLVKKFLSRKPLILDVDDWEPGFGRSLYDSLPWYKKLNDFRKSILNFRTYYYTVILDRLIFLADAVTTSGYVLKSKYGGTVIWHGRDPDVLEPTGYNCTELRQKYPYLPEDAYVAGFIGTPRPHKGIEDIIDALEILRNKRIFLFIVGMDKSEYCSNLVKRINSSDVKDNIVLFNQQPMEKLPEYLAVSDLVIIPQRKDSSSYGQVPAKIFDAMAMARPVISTTLYDIPQILKDCGWLVEPENPGLLAEKIIHVINHPEEARKKGIKARERFINDFSWDILREKLIPVIEGLD